MHESGGDEGGGYGRPPKAHQFQKGVSGNPRGRPRRAETKREIVARVRDEMIHITIDGKRKKVSFFEAGLRQTMLKCMAKGNPRDLQKLMELLEEHGVPHNDILRAEMIEGAEETVRKLFEYQERMHPVQNEAAQKLLEKQEAEIIDRFPACRVALRELWAIQDADPNGTAPSGVRRQMNPGTGFYLKGDHRYSDNNDET